MNEVVEGVEVCAPAEQSSLIARVMDLGKFVGMREAFAAIAGRCSAADIECLRRLRDERMYRDLGCTWAEFCQSQLKVSRRTVDRLIGYLDAYGPQYFYLTKLTHISVSEYRQIAAAVSEAGIDINGSVVALLPENSEKLQEAVRELLRRAEAEAATQTPKALPTPPMPPAAAVVAPPAPAAVAASRPREQGPAERIVLASEALRQMLLDVGQVPPGDFGLVRDTFWRLSLTARGLGLVVAGL